MKNSRLFEIPDKIPKGSLDGKYKQSWVQESVDFKLPQTEQANLQKRGYLGTAIGSKQMLALVLIFLSAFVAIIGRIAYLQIIKGQEYRELAEGNRLRTLPIISERGIIFDSFGKQLVLNVPNFALTLVPQDLPASKEERRYVITKISEISKVPESQIYELLEKYGSHSYASLVVKQNLDYESALALYIESGQLPGVTVQKGSKRRYLTEKNIEESNLSLSHVLGYLAKLTENEYETKKKQGYLLFDSIGRIGLESQYEEELRGIYGKKKVEVDALGKERTILSENPPTAGKNLILTLDLEAQKALERSLRSMLLKKEKKRGAAIAINPQTGGILALVSMPAYNNNDFSGPINLDVYERYISDIDRPLFNRTVSGIFPSGSTVKPLIAAAALQEKVITPRTTVISSGGIRVGKWFFKDWLSGGHGVTDVKKAIAWSVNTFFYYIGGGYGDFQGLGVKKLTYYMRNFKLGSLTGIDLPGEAVGFVPSEDWKLNSKGERWYIGDTYNLSVGQGDLQVTPIQVALWTSVIANGGKIVRPHLGDKIQDTVRNEMTPIKYENERVPISPENLRVVREGMRDCITIGSCKLLQSLSFTSAGKTGTAQWSSSKKPHAWFTAFAPAERPRIVVTVLIEEGEQGSTVSMPVARDFLAWWGKKYLKL